MIHTLFSKEELGYFGIKKQMVHQVTIAASNFNQDFASPRSKIPIWEKMKKKDRQRKLHVDNNNVTVTVRDHSFVHRLFGVYN